MSDSEVVDSVLHFEQVGRMKCRNCGKPFKFNGPMNRDVQFLCQSKKCKLARKTWLQKERRTWRRMAIGAKKWNHQAVPMKNRRSSGVATRKKSLAMARRKLQKGIV